MRTKRDNRRGSGEGGGGRVCGLSSPAPGTGWRFSGWGHGGFSMHRRELGSGVARCVVGVNVGWLGQELHCR